MLGRPFALLVFFVIAMSTCLQVGNNNNNNNNKKSVESRGISETDLKAIEDVGVVVELVDGFGVRLRSKGNDTVVVQLEGRKMKTKWKKNDVLAMLFTPAMVIAGLMPWVLPGIKMAAMMVGMMNQMAFTSALFMLIRGYIFDTTPEEHIIYINNGYKDNTPKYVKIHEHR